ncbi:MAG: glutamine--fructose-6-phosphate transaminase (isomerizing) [Candidatus Pacearchaeota archaeon]
MCGIVGYIGEKEAAPVLINGLKRLEYRGYDSFGLCVLEKDILKCFKKKGKIGDFREVYKISGKIGIAHTRWATHGEPSEINAHPHHDCKKEIMIVHNGIIENYYELKKMLKKDGHVFYSETDSEVFAHLIEKFYKVDIEKAVLRALKKVKGTFGLLVIHKNSNKIIAARKGSPIVIGVSKDGIIIASDLAPIIDYTRKVIYLDDNEIAIIKKSDYIIKSFNGKIINKNISDVNISIETIEKKGFKHFMLKEIFEQPESLKNFLIGKIKKNLINLDLKLDLKKIKRLVLVGCGTSWHAALIGKYLIEKISKIPVEVDYASEFRYRDPLLNENDLVISISQSGETADTLAALREAKSKKIKTLGIINVVGSAIARESDFVIYLHAGPEIGVASTKAFTSQLLALLIFALFLKQKKEGITENRIVNEIKSITDKIKLVLKKSEEIKKIANIFKSSKNFIYLGRGFNFPIALEGALKLKEISYIHAEGYPAAEMKHGPIALIDEDMPVVVIATNGKIFEKIISNMEEIKARKGRIISITDTDHPSIKKVSDHLIIVPKTIEEISPIINAVAIQLLAYHIADLKGLDVDKPRNLAKSVTVE